MGVLAEWSVWQDESCRCATVLREVFPWLSASELCRAGAACRAWRRAALDPPLWRRLLARDIPCGGCDASGGAWWRDEYATARGGWVLAARHARGAALLHADLAPRGDALALGSADASVALWRRSADAWRECWRTGLRARGWAGVLRVQWAPAAQRLLLAGTLALATGWELLVLQLDDDCCGGSFLSRVRCSAGAAGCWADAAGGTFLSFELQLLGPGLACTTVWLNAAEQETQSEYAGVTSPLLRIFNEDAAHLTHALVAGVADSAVLLGGSARALCAWPVRSVQLPPLLAGAPGELAERALRRRLSRAAHAPAPPEPDEQSVRAACVPADHELRLAAPLAGLTLRAGCVWAATADGALLCACARSLRVLRTIHALMHAPHAHIHYIQLSVSDHYVVSPEGGYSPRVWTWSRRSGASWPAGGDAGAGARHAGAAVSALLAPGGDMLVLAADSLYVWRLRAPPPGRDS